MQPVVRRRRAFPGSSKAVLFLILAGAALARAGWLRLESPPFEIYTDAGEPAGRRVLQGFEQIRAVFSGLGMAGRETLPVRVYVFATEAEFRPYRPNPSALGFYQNGPERDYIAMVYAGDAAYRVVFHEYTHLVLGHSTVDLPKWVEEGTAEYYSTIRADEDRVRIGSPIGRYVKELASSRWLTAAELSAVDRNSPYYNEPDRVGIFYAQSWALVHMLHRISPYRKALPVFIERLRQGVPSGEAFSATFGRPMDRAIEELRRYVAGGKFPVEEVASPAVQPAAARVTPVPPADAQLVTADLLLRVGHDAEARKVFERLAREIPQSVEAETGLATLALHEHRDADARSYLERAIKTGHAAAAVYFEYAMLLRDTGAARSSSDEYLLKTIAVNPDFAEAQFLIGLGLSDDGRNAEAIEHLRRAAAILPRRADCWHALAIAWFRLGRNDDSHRAAQNALRCAANPAEQDMAEAALRLTAHERAVTSRPPVTTPKGWDNPKGDRTVEGMLLAVDCRGSAARLHIRSGDGDIELSVADPSRVVLKNAGAASTQFDCGPQHGRRVVVDYRSADREVTSIQFE